MKLLSALYIVPTPIGHFDDITKRALDVLSEVDWIACEDTRTSAKLFNHFGIKAKTFSLHEHNEVQRLSWITEQLDKDASIALISDAGTPLISDPGYKVVAHLREHGYQVTALPGACAAIAALSAAGIPSDRFCFEGFLPAKSAARQGKLQDLLQESRTMIFYESPRRAVGTLEDMAAIWGETHRIAIARELTKVYETFLFGSVREVLSILSADENQQKGEMVIVCHGFKSKPQELPREALEMLTLLCQDLPLKQVSKYIAIAFKVNKNTVYQHGLSLKKSPLA
jgi:16S rRNA (cytidine1402-2'-O)-methyltransferase